MNKGKINHFFNRLPLHLAVIGLMLIWVIPAIGLLVTSLRPGAGDQYQRLVDDAFGSPWRAGV